MHAVLWSDYRTMCVRCIALRDWCTIASAKFGRMPPPTELAHVKASARMRQPVRTPHGWAFFQEERHWRGGTWLLYRSGLLSGRSCVLGAEVGSDEGFHCLRIGR